MIKKESLWVSSIFVLTVALLTTSIIFTGLSACTTGQPRSSDYLKVGGNLGFETVKLNIIKTETPTFGGRTFGQVGQYERLEGVLSFEVNPKNPLNKEIINIDKAPVNSKGFVEYDVDFIIIKPVDMSRGNGRILYDTVNRGSMITLRSYNDAATAYDTSKPELAGNGFIMERGYTILASGWQASYPIEGISSFLVGLGSRLPPTPTVLDARLPIAQNKDGSPITGISREVWYDPPFNKPDEQGYLTKYLTYPAANLNKNEASLTIQAHENDEKKSPPDMTWEYLDEWRIKIKAPQGYDQAAAIYEFVYPAKDPIVYGLGFAAIRDVISFFRYRANDDNGNPNPLGIAGKNPIEAVLAYGTSQTGRVLKTFIYEGFNKAGSSSLKVFDGVHISASGSRRVWVNGEFSHPGDIFGNDQFPFSYAETKDHFTSITDSLLKKCQQSGTCPKIIHTDTESEIWSSGASLTVTNTIGTQDLQMPENVRIYLYTGAKHGSGGSTDPGYGQQKSNPLNYNPLNRALLVILDEWATRGIAPPESRFPSISSKTLVPMYQFTTGFPYIPGVTYNALHLQAKWVDYTIRPPVDLGTYPVYAMKVDRDGNGIAGIRLPDIEVPVATYTGWNLTAAGYSKNNRLVTAAGSYIPFPKTKAERISSGDPRLSLEERYPSHGAYLEAVKKATLALVEQRFLLEADAQLIIESANASEIGK